MNKTNNIDLHFFCLWLSYVNVGKLGKQNAMMLSESLKPFEAHSR